MCNKEATGLLPGGIKSWNVHVTLGKLWWKSGREKRNSYVMKRGRSRCCLHVCLISLKWASWSEVRNLLKAAAHPQSLCLDVQELFGSYHHHTHGQGRPRSPIRQRQCNYNCLQNTRQRLLPVLDIPRAALKLQLQMQQKSRQTSTGDGWAIGQYHKSY